MMLKFRALSQRLIGYIIPLAMSPEWTAAFKEKLMHFYPMSPVFEYLMFDNGKLEKRP